MKHSTGNRTKAEQSRFDKMKEQGICMACYQLGLTTNYIEIHHLLSGNKHIGHTATVSLCQWHHRSVPKSDYGYHTKKATREVYGSALACGSKPFHAQFGTDKELLDMQNGFLGEVI